MFKYTCPNCKASLQLPTAAEPGQEVQCGACKSVFAPRAAVIKIAEDPKKAAPAAKKTDDDDANPYAVHKETEEELREAEKNRPKFGEVADKFRKSARGPATAALVLPTKLLIFVGILSCVVGIVWLIYGIFPLVFTDAAPSDEEVVESLVQMMLAVFIFAMGCVVCYGAFKMQTLESYTWAIVASVIGIAALVGIFSLITLRDPKVIAGFQEVEGALDEDEQQDEDEDDDEDEDEDDDDDDDDD
jgi:Zn-finger nucleic acid-binding protein